ncbi:hypothetical protein [Herbaspirillum sp. meg3]|jgi:hypothetical protein|uniref:hypothetical protein n=1 Tax=Herbaspirillum sp. meg3 TaxID=2025949 RepID=UPI0012FD9AE9|nr:hypothetical protein [Herbaspirillum sp. meg3]
MKISSSEFKTEWREEMMGAWQHADGCVGSGATEKDKQDKQKPDRKSIARWIQTRPA